MSSTKNHKKILFLCSELSEYFLACLRALQNSDGSDIHVVHFPVNPAAPFDLDFPSGIKFYQRENYSADELQKLAGNVHPDFIYCSGWIDKSYLRICRTFNKKIPVLLALDNPWKGTFRQRLASFSGFLLTSVFTHAWVPGERQKTYAKKIGFSDSQILTGVYSADVSRFHEFFLENKKRKKDHFPKQFLFAGRFSEEKGIDDLVGAFNKLEKENDWELWCAGAGKLPESAKSDPRIRNLGFIQPANIKPVIAETGVFILPSHYEPWGVALHEFAAAGFPLICSDEVGAAELFLENSKNGFMVKHGSASELLNAMKKIVAMDQSELAEMGEKSAELGLRHTPAEWTKTILSLI